MALPFFQRDIDALGRTLPFLTGALAAILSVVPVPVPGLAIATPAFALMTIYHWTVYRPDLTPPVSVFAVGILLDLLDGTPYLGLSSLSFLLARSLVLLGRGAVNQGFGIVWAGFFIVALAAIGLQWVAVGLLGGTEIASRAFLFQVLVTVAAYPACDYVLAQLQRGLLRRA